MEPSNIVLMAERLGVSFAFLILILFMLAKGAYWFGQNVVIPLTTKHLDFIDRLEKAIGQVIQTQTELTENCKQILNNTRVDIPKMEIRCKDQKENKG